MGDFTLFLPITVNTRKKIYKNRPPFPNMAANFKMF